MHVVACGGCRMSNLLSLNKPQLCTVELALSTAHARLGHFHIFRIGLGLLLLNAVLVVLAMPDDQATCRTAMLVSACDANVPAGKPLVGQLTF